MGLFDKKKVKSSPLVLEATFQKSVDYSDTEQRYRPASDFGGMWAIKDPTYKWTNGKDFAAVAQRLYYDCAPSRTCINIRSDRLSSLPVVVTQGSGVSRALIACPSPSYGSLANALRAWEMSLCLGGDLWLFLDLRIPGRPVLTDFRQDFVFWEDDGSGLVTYDPDKRMTGTPRPQYRFQMVGGICEAAWQREGTTWTPINAAVVHIMDHNPLSSFSGSGPGDAVLRAADAWVLLQDWIRHVAQRKGRKSGFISAPSLQSDQDMEVWKAAMQQLSTAGELKVLAENATFESAEFTWSEMGLNDLMNQLVRTIASAFSIPAVMMNLEGESSFANQRGADKIYYTGWLKPRAMWLLGVLQGHLAAHLNDRNLKLDIDEKSIPYLQDNVSDVEGAMVKARCYTVNEVRALRGYEALPDDVGGQLAGTTTTTITEQDADSDGNSDADEEPAEKAPVSANADTSGRRSEKSTPAKYHGLRVSAQGSR